MGPLQLRIASALKLARDVAHKNTDEVLEPHAIVFEALREAMTTLKALPDPESGWLYSQGFWPQVILDEEEKLDNYKEMLRRIASGEESPEALLGKRPPTAAAIDRMEAIFEVFPRCLAGKTRQRDWKIMSFLAAGHTMKVVGGIVRTSRETVSDRKDVQCRHIALRLVDLMPPPIVESRAPKRTMGDLDWLMAS